ncbi:hypothetical protein Ahy_B04g070688 isoform A [Arachis hypogaea]|uniref:GRF-type domain-containing protein n=3 Tax=Arachis hypogaea TaxID=3818 RepID=A0A444ZIH1_ARAHY|nr:hypothetical protein Ahy_B04g070688 isoform A [Arachis hypogaea]
MHSARARGKYATLRRQPSMQACDVDGASGIVSKSYDGCCFCPLPVVPLKSKTSSNPDRWFLRCPLWKNTEMRCGYFQWLDEIQAECVEGEVSSENSNMLGKSEPKKKGRINVDCGDGQEIQRIMMVLSVVNDMKENLKRVELCLIFMCILIGLNVALIMFMVAK